MAPVIAPQRLYSLCLSAVSHLVDHACTNIFLEHGCYGNEDCLRAMHELQKYLVTQLPTTVFEQVAEARNAGMQHSQPLWSKDARIKLAVFLHPSLTQFSVDGKGNELMQQHDDGLDEFFWCAQIGRLCNLVHLNLNLITTDDILHVLGSSCPKLEVVNVVSRIKQDISHEPNGAFPGPGITLKFCVSDFGLMALLKCQNLRRITMNKIINHSSANHGISLAGVQALVSGLPKLEFINFGSIGKILESYTDDSQSKLKLQYFSEMEPSFVNVMRLQSMCPLVQHISLSVPITMNSNGYINANIGPCNEILQALAESSLPLRILELQHFPWGESFKSLLRNKGQLIEELLFRANGQLHSQHLAFIGENCPHLRKLHLKEVGVEESPCGYKPSRLLFTELEFLHISGHMWNPTIILKYFAYSLNIRQICLLNMHYHLSLDSAVLRLLESNKLAKVESINLYNGCFLSVAIIKQLSNNCPKLRYFSFQVGFEGFETADIEVLRQETQKKNLDIKLNYLELNDH